MGSATVPPPSQTTSLSSFSDKNRSGCIQVRFPEKKSRVWKTTCTAAQFTRDLPANSRPVAPASDTRLNPFFRFPSPTNQHELAIIHRRPASGHQGRQERSHLRTRRKHLGQIRGLCGHYRGVEEHHRQVQRRGKVG